MFILLQKHAFRNIFRNRYRTCTILLTICICSLVIMLISGFYAFLFENMEKEIVAVDGHINLKSAVKNGLIDHYTELKTLLMAEPDVFQITAKLTVNGIAGYSDKSALFHGEGVVYEELERIRDFVYKQKTSGSGVNPGAKAGPAGVEVGTILARNLRLEKGAIVDMLISDAGFTTGFSLTVDRIVTTVSEKLDRLYIKMPLAVVQEHLGSDSVDTIAIVLKDPCALNKVCRALLAATQQKGWDLKVTPYNHSTSYLESVKDIYMNNYYFILVVIIIASFFTLSNIITMSVMERTKELGTMRSFGMQKKHLVQLFMSEGFYIGLLGSSAGVLLSLLVILLVNSLGGFYIPPQPTAESGFHAFLYVSAPAIGLATGISVLIGLVASFIATIRLNFLSIIEELQHV